MLPVIAVSFDVVFISLLVQVIYPTKKKRNNKIIPLSSPFDANSYQIVVKRKCDLVEYMCLPYEQETSM